MKENQCEEIMSVERVPRFLQPYEWAKKEWAQNIRELPSKEQNNPRILWYHSLTTLRATDDETPWCSSFMCAAAFSAAFKSTRSAAAKSWLGYGVEGNGSIGDIVIFSRAGGHHVAFVHKVYKPGDKNICVLGGNQGNSVSVANYKAENLLAFRRFES